MSSWMRLYTEALNDPKVQMLSGDNFKAWVNIMLLVKERDSDGVLPPLDDVAFALRISLGEATTMVVSLKKAGLLDADEHCLFVHGWEKRQYRNDSDPSNAERQKRYREKRRSNSNGLLRSVTPVTVTPPDTDTDTDTDTEQNREESETAVAASPAPKLLDFPATPKKRKHGAHNNVLLTDDEYSRLQFEFVNATEAIEFLSEHIAMKGYKAKDHNLAIRKWVFTAVRERDLKLTELAAREARAVPSTDDVEAFIAKRWGGAQ